MMLKNTKGLSPFFFSAVLAVHLLMPWPAAAQPPQMPPAAVVLAPVRQGAIQPQSPWVGTVRFAHVADVASEVDGRVQEVRFEEGSPVKAGEILAQVDTALRDRTLAVLQAQQAESRVELEFARTQFNRFTTLQEKNLIAQQTFDEYRYRVLGLEKRLAANAAEVERLAVEIGKSRVVAPFDAVVLKRNTEPGEWLDKGGVVGTLAASGQVEGHFAVPASVILYLDPERAIPVEVGGRELTGRLLAVIPMGDNATRTFPVKVRLPASPLLMEGMEARAWLPTAAGREGLLVPRDAVVQVMGRDVVYTVTEGAAHQVPVTVLGYEGGLAGVEATGLATGASVVVKGAERLRDGQAVQENN